MSLIFQNFCFLEKVIYNTEKMCTLAEKGLIPELSIETDNRNRLIMIVDYFQNKIFKLEEDYNDSNFLRSLLDSWKVDTNNLLNHIREALNCVLMKSAKLRLEKN